MKIVGYECSSVRIPLETPFVTALRHVEAVEALRLEIIGDDGRIGIGEAPSTEAITGATITTIRQTLRRHLLPTLPKGDILVPDRLLDPLQSFAATASNALALFDIALHDLLVPLSGDPPSIETLVTVSLDTPTAMAAQAEEFSRRGHRKLKIKLGGPIDEDLQRCTTIHRIAPKARLYLDPNQSWRLADAFSFLAMADGLPIALIEQPLPADDIEGMRRLSAASPIPILADESVFDLEQLVACHTGRVAHGVNIKVMKCGGLLPAERMLRYCRRHRIPVMLGSMLETPASIRAAFRLAMAFGDVIEWYDLDSPLLYRNTEREEGGFWLQDKRLGLRSWRP